MKAVVSLEAVQFVWPGGPALLDVRSFEMSAGERVLLHGPSGCGKSTLLGLIAGVLVPQQGHIRVLDQDMTALSGRGRDALRAADLGVVFQMFNLLPFLNVLQNVTLACEFSKMRRSRLTHDLDTEARALLARLGLEDEALLQRKITALSVGQQQRVAVARALLGEPRLIIADEPTSALDTQARDAFMDLLFRETRRSGAALLMVSHDHTLSGRFDRALNLADINHVDKKALAL